ncbi:hypothetical protein OOT46_30440 [Aquabacterium sp. A7-Y]|uniref:hypothetical protein n=1 Tax=Aquabacterium sp. A7-Y TaxID=1349605 RepID=UPI00223DEA50|nr:hypothetical protein [Aquabacterium sp. A7-Y]MCW7542118.1 hypothetical protein [Aquabacterium sp. A7-Y]
MNPTLQTPPLDALGELGLRLHQDHEGSLLAQYLETFDTGLQKSQARLALPLPPAQYDEARAIARSAELAREVVLAVWHSLHPGGSVPASASVSVHDRGRDFSV